MTASDTAAGVTPYIAQLLENSDARENLRDAAQNIRGAYGRAQKRRAKTARDERFRSQVQAAARSITEAGRALRSGRQKPRQRWGRGLLFLLGLGSPRWESRWPRTRSCAPRSSAPRAAANKTQSPHRRLRAPWRGFDLAGRTLPR